MDELKTNDYLKGIVLNLPESPGIYQYLNAEGTIIYVGKAKNLKRRVSSYFNREHEPGKTRVLVSKIADTRKRMPCCWRTILSRNTNPVTTYC